MEKIITTKIIQRYESSNKSDSGLKEGNMSVNFTSFKEYNNDSNYKYRIHINTVANELEDKGLIKIKWVSKDNIIDRLFFNLKDMDIFYRLAGITDKKDILLDIEGQLKVYDDYITNYSIKHIFSDWKMHLLEKHRIPKIIEDKDKRELIVNALKGIDELLKNNDTIYERVFSKRYLGNSKIFEKQLRGTVISLLRKYFNEVDNNMDEDEVLKVVGIEKTTSELHLKGNIEFKLKENNIKLACFSYGVALNSHTIKELKLQNYRFDKVISVENKANFNYLCAKEKESLIIFTGGFYTPVQKRFLNRLYKKLINCDKCIEFYHWGDIDLGGVNIYRNIKSFIFYNVKPYLMNIQIMKEYSEYWEFIEDNKYILKLKKLLEDETIKELHDLISFVIENKVTLEQESMII
ncbi:DUF2220 domain-containing protein [Clostridium estertheticum]|uniref:Wadjet anti-phage system protein JetD domain-containing protein n=1 Tax=Clostridium estertheticum TaxID=238834 RepID=UPI0013E95D76|nr:Wadjet anti-phage system protein JetD domain-containing protein [Clostridium estertheticum]MBZ9685766.1 DUF2220 domain-containing protein [Clostridium estertheticum]